MEVRIIEETLSLPEILWERGVGEKSIQIHLRKKWNCLDSPDCNAQRHKTALRSLSSSLSAERGFLCVARMLQEGF